MRTFTIARGRLLHRLRRLEDNALDYEILTADIEAEISARLPVLWDALAALRRLRQEISEIYEALR